MKYGLLALITITSDIKTRKFLEVGVLKAFLVSVQSAHYSRPRSPENLQHKHGQRDSSVELGSIRKSIKRKG